MGTMNGKQDMSDLDGDGLGASSPYPRLTLAIDWAAALILLAVVFATPAPIDDAARVKAVGWAGAVGLAWWVGHVATRGWAWDAVCRWMGWRK